MIKVKGIYVYPVKSCKAVELTAARLTYAGLVFDRQWVIVRADNGKFITQRQVPKIGMIEATLPVALFTCNSIAEELQDTPDASLTICVPGGIPIRVPLSQSNNADLRQITVWYWNGPAADEGDLAAEYLSQYLGLPVRLMRYVGSEAHQKLMGVSRTLLPSQELIRNTSPEFAVGYEMKFSDQFPLLITSEASMANLNSRLSTPPLQINRFRGNIVVEGGLPWEEDYWRDVDLVPATPPQSPIRLVLAKPCSRCKVPNIEQETATPGEEPGATLDGFRTGAQLGWAAEKKSFTHMTFFGAQMVPQGTGLVAVGDELRQLSRREGFVPVQIEVQ